MLGGAALGLVALDLGLHRLFDALLAPLLPESGASWWTAGFVIVLFAALSSCTPGPASARTGPWPAACTRSSTVDCSWTSSRRASPCGSGRHVFSASVARHPYAPPSHAPSASVNERASSHVMLVHPGLPVFQAAVTSACAMQCRPGRSIARSRSTRSGRCGACPSKTSPHGLRNAAVPTGDHDPNTCYLWSKAYWTNRIWTARLRSWVSPRH